MIMGHRGKRVKDAQVKKGVEADQCCKVDSVKEHYKEYEMDVISCIDGKTHQPKKNTKRTSQKVNCCYIC